MQPALLPQPGARVNVTWTDGRNYAATVVSVAPGFVNVRWDAGGAHQWVPLHAVAPLVVQAAAPMSAAGPAPGGWNMQPLVARPQQAQPVPPAQPAQPAQPVQPAPAARPAQPAQPAPAARPAQQAAQLPPVPQGPPPRPMAAKIRDLPRGLVYEPTGSGPGNGKAFFLLFGFVSTVDVDLAMRMTDIDHIGDDVAALRAAGFRVVVDLHADLESLNAALAGTHPEAGGAPAAGVFWSGHGDDDGTIATHEGGWIAPEQIVPEAAQKGTVKLFVMSACHAGNHVPRWQKALGPQAQIIGWGAPITNQRAIEFLVPDDKNAKGFDDLLEKHLGVRRVAADGPLAEVKELALKHEDRVATMLLPLDELATLAQKRLKCPMDKNKDGDAWFFTVRTPPSKDFPDQPRSQLVRVSGMGVADAWVTVTSIVGPYSDALDLARALRATASALQVRVTIGKIVSSESEFIFCESILRRRRLDPFTFANAVSMVGTCADKLEDMFFGSDKR
jgi:hypothetical protein